MTPAREQAIRSRREAMEKPSTLLGVGVFRDSGETGDINTAMINNLGFKDLMFTYNQDKTKANNLGVDEITLKGIAASINAGGASALKAQQEARNLNIMLGSSSAIRGGISPLQQSIIAKTPEKFGMRAALINQFRGGTTAAELGLDADSKKEDIRGAFDSTTGTFKKGGGAGPPQAQTRVPVLRPNFSYNPTVNVTVNGKPAENVLVEHLKPLDPDE
jgi:hypothetical protein